MKNPGKTNFVILTEDTLETIAEELKKDKGIIIVADPQYANTSPPPLRYEFEIHLFDKPTIDAKREWIDVPRGTKKVGREEWQTGWEKDRMYRIYRKPQPQKIRGGSRCKTTCWSDGFDELTFGDFRLSIHMQSQPVHPLKRERYDCWQAYYIPRSASPRAAFTHALNWMLLELWNTKVPPEGGPEKFRFTKEHIKTMVDYMLKDLKNGKVLARNIEAGMMADACGWY